MNVGGKQWDLWIGMNGAMKVFSFISPQQTNQWSGDAKQFFTYLQNSQGFPASSQNLIGRISPLYMWAGSVTVVLRVFDADVVGGNSVPVRH